MRKRIPQRKIEILSLIIHLCRPASVRRQRQRLITGQSLLPVGQLTFTDLTLQIVTLPFGIVPIGDIQGRQLAVAGCQQSTVNLRQLVHKNINGPAINGNMVPHHQ